MLKRLSVIGLLVASTLPAMSRLTPISIGSRAVCSLIHPGLSFVGACRTLGTSGRCRTSGPLHASTQRLSAARVRNPSTLLYASASTSSDSARPTLPPRPLRRGDAVQAEVLYFGPLGATVHIVGAGHGRDVLLSDEPLGRGLILQREIAYFREGRRGIDVVVGEILPAWVEKVHEDTGLTKVDASLRPHGGGAKAEQVANSIMALLMDFDGDGSIPIGDKSLPREIAQILPGVSKGTFKKALSLLYKKRQVIPGPFEVLINEGQDEK
eukprot:CAMPEP_0194279678 /NCGR_PEP_ID=MMETSP0169-20130528/14065_1 /TAXON_ID=218684 /ORGANISM="Corethron pennatum, Strain L29A3" /LENGTH=267 /DNA_ID=CAMNT_0039024131 /DNA_START=37 /DNA_END=840 /DNA_ORIENTATION=-